MNNLCNDTMIESMIDTIIVHGMISTLSALLNWGFGKASGESAEAKSDQKLTLFIGDSHQKSLIAGDLERGLDGNLVHGILPARSYSTLGGHPWRAYNSSFNWIVGCFIIAIFQQKE